MHQDINAGKAWEDMNSQEKKKALFFRQKDTLDKFLERHAISQAQYDKSLHDLIVKMKIAPELLSKL